MRRLFVNALSLSVLLSALVAFTAPAMGQGNPFDTPPGQIPGQPPSNFGDSRDRVTVTARAAVTDVTPGSEVPIAVVFNHQPKWHTWPPKGVAIEGADVFEGAIHTTIEPNLPDDAPLVAHTGFIQYPSPHLVAMNLLGTPEPQQLAVMEDQAITYVPFTVADNATPGELTITFSSTFQSCDDRTCLPPAFGVEYAVTLNIVEGDPIRAADLDLNGIFANFDASVFQKIAGGEAPPVLTSSASKFNAGTLGGFIAILLLAAVGGFLLNFTPCVLPVIPLKIMSLAQGAGNRARTLLLGIMMCLGIIAFWMGLGVAVASISGLSTNELFQYPIFPISVGIVIVIMAIAMCGVFNVRLPQALYRVNPKHDSIHGSFMFGVMTAILSTPCTAPFMGAAITASVGQSSAVVLSVFAAIGIGMSIPYFILAAKPSLVEKMPRTGPASELIKQVMALFMLAAGAYFIGVGLSGQFAQLGEPPSRLYWWFVGGCAALAGAWLLIRTVQITSSATRRAIFGGLGIAIIVTSVLGVRILTDKGPVPWKYYTPERLESELAAGNVVVLKFTAEWCANCHFLERTVIYSDSVVELLSRDDVTPMKVDITNKKAAGNELLTQYWRSIPYLVVERPDGSVAFQADWYTAGDVVEGIQAGLGQSTVAANVP